MSRSDIPRINFTISENAKRGIELVRQMFNAQSSDPAAVPCIGWGRFMPHTGPYFENVVVSFYGQSQLHEIAPAIREVSGIKLVFLPMARYLPKFEGRVLDYSENGGFFLRERRSTDA